MSLKLKDLYGRKHKICNIIQLYEDIETNLCNRGPRNSFVQYMFLLGRTANVCNLYTSNNAFSALLGMGIHHGSKMTTLTSIFYFFI